MQVDLDQPLDINSDESAILKELSEKLSAKGSYHSTTVRNFIRWFGAYRRGPLVVDRIEESLAKFGLQAEPDFRTTYIDNYLKVTKSLVLSKTSGGEIKLPPTIESDPTFRVSQLESANRSLVSVVPQDKLAKAVSLMLAHDYSQLPVLSDSRTIRGVISWKSIGSKLAVVGGGSNVSDFLTSCTVVEHDRPIFEVYDLIYRNEFVIVRSQEKTFSGIVTTSDLSDEFRKISEAFLVLGEIEKNIRIILERWNKLPAQKIEEICKISKFEGFHKLTFGGYLRIMENIDFWSNIPLKLDRVTIVELMDKIRVARNNVMHFSPDSNSEDELRQIRNFSALLQKLVGFQQ